MFKNYLLTAFRNFRKNKVFSFINVLGLTLGIACSVAIFMIVRYELSFDNFHAHPERIYRVVSDFRFPEGVEYQSGVPYPLPEAFKHEFPQVAQVATIVGASNTQISLPQGGNTETRRFREKEGFFYTDAAFFAIFHFKWEMGDPRVVLAQPGTVALTRHTAEKYFGDWHQAMGRTILVDNKELLTVQGILADPPSNTDFPIKGVISFATMAGKLAGKGWGTVSSRYQCYVLLPQDGSLTSIVSQMPVFRKKYVDIHTDFFSLQPLRDIHFNALYGNFGARTINKETLWALSLIGAFLLALGCINFINLATAQAIHRSREVGIRKVLGSRRWQLAFQFLGETALQVGMAVLLAMALVTLLSPLATEVLNGSYPLKPLHSLVTMLFVVVLALVVTVVSGAYPAMIISGFRPIAALKNKMVAGKTRGSLSLRRVLVVSQFVIAQVLIVGVLVAISQMNFFRNAPLGFNKEAIVTINLPEDSASHSRWVSFRQQLLQQPGIEKVSLSSNPPAGKGNSFSTFRYNQSVKDENFELNVKLADTGYFTTYGLTLIAGRVYQPSDTIREFVVNETFLRKEGIHDPGDVLGKYIYIDGQKAPIVGVVRDFHEHSLRDPIDPAAISTNRDSYSMAGIKLSTTGMPSTIQQIQKIFNGAFPETVFEHQFLDETIARYYEQEEKLSKIFKIFAVLSLLISCLGLYGLILFTTSQRIREVGIRKVLGASITSISLLFVREFLWLIGIAFVIASPLAWYFMHKWLQNFTYRIDITPWMFAATGMTALVVGLLTISFQTIRAALANPVKSLKTDC
ncbi:MAG TPA: ABC transporter permease [Puia sp.]|nr:ABC transporter permease [Puia sp.]